MNKNVVGKCFKVFKQMSKKCIFGIRFSCYQCVRTFKVKSNKNCYLSFNQVVKIMLLNKPAIQKYSVL